MLQAIKRFVSGHVLLFAVPLAIIVAIAIFFLLPVRHHYTIGLDTTRITTHVLPDGSVDYATFINERFQPDVTPENNAVVLLWQAFGPKNWPRNSAEYSKWLGIPKPDETGNYFVKRDEFVTIPDLKDVCDETAQIEGMDDEEIDTDRAKMLFSDYNKELFEYSQKWPWKTEQIPQLALWISQNERPLELIHKASRCTCFFSPRVVTIDSEKRGCLYFALLPATDILRYATELLICRAMLHLGENRPLEAWEDIMACHRLGILQERGGSLTEALVGYRFQFLAMQTALIFLNQAKLNREMLLRCQKDLENLFAKSIIIETLDLNERLASLDFVQYFTTHPDKFFNRETFPPFNAADPLAALLKYHTADCNATMRMINQGYDQVVSKLKIADREIRRNELEDLRLEGEAFEIESKNWSWSTHFIGPQKRGELFGLYLVADNQQAAIKIDESIDRLSQTRDILRIAMALAAYRLDHGRYPEKLDQLKPRYLPEIPIDIFANAPLHYQIDQNGYNIYSIGPNRLDDGGRNKHDSPAGDDLSVRMPMRKIEMPTPIIKKDAFDP